MTKRIVDLAKGVSASVVIAAIVAAVPYVLWRYAGLPGQNTLETFRDSLTSDETRNQALLSGVLVVIAWLCWAQVAYALCVEVGAALRGTAAASRAALPGVQSFAARLVATATLTGGSFAPTVSVAAAPLVAPMPVVEMLEAATVSTGDADTAAPRLVNGHVAGPRYIAGARDTFWSIAEDTLGDGLRWHEIRAANVGRRMPDGTTIAASTEVVEPGWTLTLPADAPAPLRRVAADTQPSETELIEVQTGDNFWSIAAETLANDWQRQPTDAEIAPYWVDLIEANEDRLQPPEDPDLIYPGQELHLIPIPDDPSAAEAPVIDLPVRPPTPEPPEPATPATTSTPTTTAAPTTTTTDAAALADSSTKEPGSAKSDSGDRDVLYAAGIGSFGVGAGIVALALRRRRANQLAKRTPTAPIEPPTPEASDYEQRTRPVADAEAVRWIEATNQLISQRLATRPGHGLPAVVAMRAGKYGVEILLDEACPPPDGFRSANDANTAWRLHPDLELPMIEAESAHAQPYSPALVAVGTSEAGDLLLDLEQLAAVTIEGDPKLRVGWLRSLATSLATSRWSEHTHIVTIGLPEDFNQLPRTTSPDDPERWCDETIAAMTQLHDASRGTTYEQRIKPGDVHHPTVVLIGEDPGDLSERLAEAAHLVNTPLAVITTTTVADAERIHLESEMSTLEPAGVAFRPAITEPAEVKVVTELVDSAEAPAAELPDPPVEEVSPAAIDGEPSESVANVIERICHRRPIEIRLLAPTPSTAGIEPEPTGKLVAVICYLAFHREVPTQRIRDTFWPGGNRKTADNAISDIRRLLGADSDGKPRLGDATNNGNYEVADEIGCDWIRVERLIAEAGRRPPVEAAELRRAALELVEGQAGRDAPTSTYGWLVDDHETYSRIATTISDAAHRLGEYALSDNQPALARWAAGQGLAAVPGCEAMFRLQMRAAALAGNTRGIHEAYETAAKHAATMGTWVEVEPETDELLQALTQGEASIAG